MYAVDDCVLSHETIVPRFSESSVSSNGIFITTLKSKANRTNTLESSSNLSAWSTNAFIFSRSGSAHTQTAAVGAARFFRARLLPEH